MGVSGGLTAGLGPASTEACSGAMLAELPETGKGTQDLMWEKRCWVVLLGIIRFSENKHKDVFGGF